MGAAATAARRRQASAAAMVAAAVGGVPHGATARHATPLAAGATPMPSRRRQRSSTSFPGTARSWSSSSSCRQGGRRSRRSRETKRHGLPRAPRCSPLPPVAARRGRNGCATRRSRASGNQWRRPWQRSEPPLGCSHLEVHLQLEGRQQLSRLWEEEAEVQRMREPRAAVVACQSVRQATCLRLPCCGLVSRARRHLPSQCRLLGPRRQQQGMRKVGCFVTRSATLAGAAAKVTRQSAHSAIRALWRIFCQCFASALMFCHQAMLAGGQRQETVVLPQIDARGRAVPGAFGREEAGNGMADGGGASICRAESGHPDSLASLP